MSGLGHLAMQESQAQPQLPIDEVLQLMAASGMKKGPLAHLKAQLLRKAAVEPLAPLAVKHEIEEDMTDADLASALQAYGVAETIESQIPFAGSVLSSQSQAISEADTQPHVFT